MPTRQDGVEDRDKVYQIQYTRACTNPIVHTDSVSKSLRQNFLFTCASFWRGIRSTFPLVQLVQSLDSLFARLGSALIKRARKREFRDWTTFPPELARFQAQTGKLHVLNRTSEKDRLKKILYNTHKSVLLRLACRDSFAKEFKMAFAKMALCMAGVLVMFRMFCYVATEQYSKKGREDSQLGMMLERHIFKRITGPVMNYICLLECEADIRCQSFNYVISDESCELNDRTKEARPEDYVPNSDRFYFGRYRGRGS